MFDWLFGKRKPEAEKISVRRWEAAKDNRLNSEHWSHAVGNSLNADLDLYGNNLRIRCEHEASTNPFVDGVIETHITDLVGRDHPLLQVQSENKSYNERLEEIWYEWWEMPDYLGRLSGPEFLKLCVRLLWVNGEFFFQIVSDEDGQIKIHAISPKRVSNPLHHAGKVGENLIANGVERNSKGRIVAYWVESDEELAGTLTHHARIPADQIIHGFITKEPGQVRGIPWLAPSLQSIADLRDYDTQVMDAARSAASFAMFLYTDHPDAKYIQVNEQTSIPRGVMSTVPPGWKPAQVNPNQPAATYIDYRSERLREIGKPVNMPLMMIKLDSSNHNFSSARFDAQVYHRGNQSLAGWFERVLLNRMFRLIEREAILSGAVDVALALGEKSYAAWTWPVPAHVDPVKEANASQIRLQAGLSSLADETAAFGRDWEVVSEQRARERERLEELGLTSSPSPSNEDEEIEEDDEEDDENNDQDEGKSNAAA